MHKADKITIGIATIPGREQQLIKTVNSLCNQSIKPDMIGIVFNGHLQMLSFANYLNVKTKYNKDNKGDAEKFIFQKKGFYLSCDDDIIYPYDYIEKMRSAITEHRCIVTWHGKTFTGYPIQSYYRDGEKFHCKYQYDKITVTHFGGTGCMGFHSDFFKPSMKIFKEKNMADVWVGLEAVKKQIPILIIPHSPLQIQNVSGSIYETCCDKDELQTKIINDFMKNNNTFAE